MSWLLQITSKAPCAATAPAPWIVRIHMPPLETHQGSLASIQRAAMWRWSPPPTVKCPLEALPPSWAVRAGMSMMLVSVLLLWCVELCRLLQLMASLVTPPLLWACTDFESIDRRKCELPLYCMQLHFLSFSLACACHSSAVFFRHELQRMSTQSGPNFLWSSPFTCEQSSGKC